MASTLMGLTSTTLGMFLNIGMALIVCLVGAALFFGIKYGIAWNRKRKNFKIEAVIYHPDGTFHTERIGKFRTADGIDKMLFQKSTETMPVIHPKYIVALKVTLWRYAPGQYAVIPPKVWNQDPKKFDISVINMQMKNFAFLEQRAAVSRWQVLKDVLQKWGWLIGLIAICIVAGVTIYMMTKYGMSMFSSVAAQRIADCKDVCIKLIPNATQFWGGQLVPAPN